MIVVGAPCRNHAAGMAQRREQVFVEAFLAHPPVEAHLLNIDGEILTEMLTLSKLQPMPTGLIFGCYTCPIFRGQAYRMKEIIRRYKKNRFLFVYVIEARPTDGWNTPSNKAENVMYRQPQDLLERSAIAHAWRETFELHNPIVLDWPDEQPTSKDGSACRLAEKQRILAGNHKQRARADITWASEIKGTHNMENHRKPFP